MSDGSWPRQTLPPRAYSPHFHVLRLTRSCQLNPWAGRHREPVPCPQRRWCRQESAGTKIDAGATFGQLGSTHKPSAADSAKHPTMHKTDSIDYLVVISGSMHMLMEEGEVELHAGDCIVQRGTNHAWVNRSGKPCVLAAVLIDAKPAP